MKMKFLLGVAALTLSAIAHAELVVIAHPGLSVDSLTHSQVSRIFFNQANRFPDGTPASPLDVSDASRDQFIRQVLNKTPQQVEKYWARMIFTGRARPPREVGPDEVKKMVTQTPGAISYLDEEKVDKSVKAITLVAD